MKDIFIEALFGFVALFIIAKVLGKTQIKQLTAFDFISALIFGELVGNGIYDDKVGVKEVAFAVFLWGAFLYIVEILTQKFKRTRSVFEGKPEIVIRNGQLQRDALKRGKLDINQLQHLLRSQGAFSVREVEFAVLETDGSVSVLKKTLDQTPKRSDLNLMVENVALPWTLIMDGEIVQDNLAEINQDEQWLEQELQKQKIESYQDVFYAEYKEGEALFVQTY
ncbi:DUF421 domain-containing protein [Aquibacillus sediminis]|uniref:DUF421 domain-containing protein n=1 Tax=Aquibacillus sediminis TaxID=2574734 RepID=UPI001109C6FE|nr:DUF421 domain-containing protein [Aquibacillus sediminis]